MRFVYHFEKKKTAFFGDFYYEISKKSLFQLPFFVLNSFIFYFKSFNALIDALHSF